MHSLFENTIFFKYGFFILTMGFLGVFTGGGSKLTKREKERFEEYSMNNFSFSVNLDKAIAFVESATHSEIVKLKNAIARVEDEREGNYGENELTSDEVSITKDVEDELDSDESLEEKVEENVVKREERVEETEKIEQGDELKSKEEVKLESKEEVKENKEKVEIIKEEKADNEHPIEKDDFTVVSSDNSGEDMKDNEISQYNDNYDEEFEIEDIEMSSLRSKSLDDEDEPILFSIVHDELMELFSEGKVVLLKEEFIFPSIGKKETLAFGIYNSSYSQLKEQIHWFVSNLKQFSRLKECKMLLSEDFEKDLILDVSDRYAILISFKTTNLISSTFEFNKKWN